MRKSRRETIYLLHLYISIIFFSLIIVRLHVHSSYRSSDVRRFFFFFFYTQLLFLKGADGCSKQTVLKCAQIYE